MMESNRRRTRRERTRVRTNHSLSKVSSLQSLIAQVVFDKFSHRPVEEYAPGLSISIKPVFNLLACGRLADPHISHISWPQGIAQSANRIVHCAPTLHIPGRKIANLILAALIIVPKLNARIVSKRNKKPCDRRSP